MRIVQQALSAAALALVACSSVGEAVEVGDPGPKISATTDTGETWNSSEHYQDGTVVFFFFPAAMTGG